MTPKPSGRTQECGREQARVRLTQAQSFLEVAELVIDEEGDLETAGVAAALAVLAGIAAADAACCFALGRRSRAQDHRQAVQLVAEVGSEGKKLSNALGRLLDVKDGAHYGVVFVGAQTAKGAIRHAKVLVDGAAVLLRTG
ncbi:hypothetical protein EV643_106370 [Kribbella sp. VKM Ac-2527]|uniref:Uncharacterized protein n=1 Tax=Kribbella caucasensis TaxID=2512215 RepID=A0A4R6KFZ0_9ACTN|nr:hypothetical protein [Kribbella sp. VKM Ac-2527]TDO49398.1 hypothetical protein EV643_106370 [Kribbella sp. VKM Ac-2527]